MGDPARDDWEDDIVVDPDLMDEEPTAILGTPRNRRASGVNSEAPPEAREAAKLVEALMERDSNENHIVKLNELAEILERAENEYCEQVEDPFVNHREDHLIGHLVNTILDDRRLSEIVTRVSKVFCIDSGPSDNALLAAGLRVLLAFAIPPPHNVILTPLTEPAMVDKCVKVIKESEDTLSRAYATGTLSIALVDADVTDGLVRDSGFISLLLERLEALKGVPGSPLRIAVPHLKTSEDMMRQERSYILQCLEAFGESSEVLAPIFKAGTVETLIGFLKSNDGDMTLLLDTMEALASLLPHKKFGVAFYEAGGVQPLLTISPDTPYLNGSIARCYYSLATVGMVMEKLCSAYNHDVDAEKGALHIVTKNALSLLKKGTETTPEGCATKQSLLFLCQVLHYPKMLKLFDSLNGLRITLQVLNFESNPLVTSLEQQLIHHAIVCIRQYFRAHLILAVEQLKQKASQWFYRSGQATEIQLSQIPQTMRSLLHPSNIRRTTGATPIENDSAAVFERLKQFGERMKVSMCSRTDPNSPIVKFMEMNGIMLVLNIVYLPPAYRLQESVASALEIMFVATLMPQARQALLACRITAPNDDEAGPARGQPPQTPLPARNQEGHAGTTTPQAGTSRAAVTPGAEAGPSNAIATPGPTPGRIHITLHPTPSQPSAGAPATGEAPAHRTAPGIPGVAIVLGPCHPAGPKYGHMFDLDLETISTISLEGRGPGSTPDWRQASTFPDAELEAQRTAWAWVRAENGIKILLNTVRLQRMRPTYQTVRALSCKALLGLSRDAAFNQILHQLDITRILSDVLNEPPPVSISRAVHYHDGWKVMSDLQLFHACAVELMSQGVGPSGALLKGPADNAMRKMEREAIVQNTRLDYNHDSLLMLIRQHLLSSGLSSAAAELTREAKLTAPPAPPSPMGPPAGVTSPVRGRLMISRRERDRQAEDAMPPLSLGGGSVSVMSGSASSATKGKHPSTETLGTGHQHNHYHAQPSRTESDQRVTLDTIVRSYLRSQHAQCHAPISVAPEVDLLEPHSCPDPPASNATNITKRVSHSVPLGMRNLDVMNHRRETRSFVYSRFTPLKYRFAEDDESEYDDMPFTCTFTHGLHHSSSSGGGSLVMGTTGGNIKIFDTMLGTLRGLMASAHPESCVLSLDLANDDRRLISASHDLVCLWDISKQLEQPVYGIQRPEGGNLVSSWDNYRHGKLCSTHPYVFLTNEGTTEVRDLNKPGTRMTVMRNVTQKDETYGCCVHPDRSCVLFSHGVLYDWRTPRPIHSFDKLTNFYNASFHPAGNEIIISSEIWELRKFKLLNSHPTLKNCDVAFNRGGDVLYAYPRHMGHEPDPILPVIPSRSLFKKRGGRPYFYTVDCTTYTSIARVNVSLSLQSSVHHIATDSQDSHIAVIDVPSITRDDVISTQCRLFGVGRLPGPEDEDGEVDVSDSNHDDDDSDTGASDLMPFELPRPTDNGEGGFEEANMNMMDGVDTDSFDDEIGWEEDDDDVGSYMGDTDDD